MTIKTGDKVTVTVNDQITQRAVFEDADGEPRVGQVLHEEDGRALVYFGGMEQPREISTDFLSPA